MTHNHLSSNELNNPEQQHRREIADAIVADSEGTVGLYTTQDFTREEKDRMLLAQDERGGTPAERLYADRGGWGDYGERPLDDRFANASRQLEEHGINERLLFLPGENGKVEALYSFSQPGYTDDTGRPGNSLSVQFSLSPAKAELMRQAIEADPDFINQIVEAQVAAIGIDTDSKRWQRKLKPNYFYQFQEIVKQKDRQLMIADVDHDGNVSDFQSHEYGEDKSLLSTGEAPRGDESIAVPSEALESEQMIEPVEEVSKTPEELAAEDEQYDKDVALFTQSFTRETDEMLKNGRPIAEIITFLEAERDEYSAMLKDPNLKDDAIDKASAGWTATENLRKQFIERQAHGEAVSSALSDVEAAFLSD